jgi:transcriptional regulator with XRE-family HTH domain
LRKLRKDAGLSQEEVAQRLGTTQSFIGKCERGERRLDIIELQEFCQALNTSLAEIVRQLEEAQGLSNEQLRQYMGEEWP